MPVPFPDKDVPPGTKFVPVSVTLTIWPAIPDDGVICDNVGGATDEMRHAWIPDGNTPLGNWLLKALKIPLRSSGLGTYAFTDKPEAN